MKSLVAELEKYNRLASNKNDMLYQLRYGKFSNAGTSKEERERYKPQMTVDEMIEDAYRTDPDGRGMSLEEINALIKEAHETDT